MNFVQVRRKKFCQGKNGRIQSFSMLVYILVQEGGGNVNEYAIYDVSKLSNNLASSLSVEFCSFALFRKSWNSFNLLIWEDMFWAIFSQYFIFL